jgi:2-oxoglutarate dehydrogenase complex dehydrogenase (E1) component-like enzyme
VSAIEDFTSGSFQPVLADPGIGGEPLDDADVSRVLLCSGKIFYDLQQAREKRGAHDVAIVRVEQLYPVPGAELAEAAARYPGVQDFAWVQEEPANQGGWPFAALNFTEHLPSGVRLRRVSRPASASPAAGAQSVHEEEQLAVIDAAFA